MNRLEDIKRFYEVLSKLEDRLEGKRLLRDLGNYRDWPQRGVYFFFEPNEQRADSGEGLRVTRVGTHALTRGSRSTLRQRLGQHRGTGKGGGNHRGSIFRLLVGQALTESGAVSPCPSWGVKGDLTKAAAALNIDREAIRNAERPVEEAVTNYIGQMPFLWLDIGDAPSPESARGYIERNAIALLSNYDGTALDPASANWLGRHSNRILVQRSQLWNQRHVTESYDTGFVSTLARIADRKAE
tara:strand:- start:3571 stop:4296 length:726 start_codon:yes stop_codon:yes gene_type:complete